MVEPILIAGSIGPYKKENKVKALINCETFEVDNWQSYKIEGWPSEENKI